MSVTHSVSIGGSSAYLEAGIVSLEAAGVTGNTVDALSGIKVNS